MAKTEKISRPPTFDLTNDGSYRLDSKASAGDTHAAKTEIEETYAQNWATCIPPKAVPDHTVWYRYWDSENQKVWLYYSGNDALWCYECEVVKMEGSYDYFWYQGNLQKIQNGPRLEHTAGSATPTTG